MELCDGSRRSGPNARRCAYPRNSKTFSHVRAGRRRRAHVQSDAGGRRKSSYATWVWAGRQCWDRNHRTVPSRPRRPFAPIAPTPKRCTCRPFHRPRRHSGSARGAHQALVAIVVSSFARAVGGALLLMCRDQRAQAELSMTRQKLVGRKLSSLKASTSLLTVPNVLFGRCFIPS